MNELTRAFLADLRSRYAVDDGTLSISEWIEANTTLRGAPFRFDRYGFQRQIADDLHQNLVCRKCSQVGLALALDTPVPTTTGWTTMGGVRVGDRLFDETGTPCSVTYISPVYTDHDCYRITFDDGESVVADAGHRWFVECDRPFNTEGVNRKWKGRLPAGASMSKSGVLDTRTLSREYRRGNRNLFAIPNTAPLAGHDDPLPIDPYYLGCWLGDGNSHASCLTAHEADAPHFTAELTRRGMVCTLSNRRGTTLQFMVRTERDPDLCPRGHRKSEEGVVGSWRRCRKCRDQDTALRLHGTEHPPSVPYDTMARRLTLLGVLANKHIPQTYLRASVQARRDLLRGLLDTDGSITIKGRVSFHNTNPQLVTGVEELARSLGYKTRTRWRSPSPSLMQSGHLIDSKLPIAEVSFVTYRDEPVFLLPRKAERLRTPETGRPTEALRRRIVSIEPTPSVPVRCLTVDSPSHLFLAGRGMIPTHNTETQLRKFLAMLSRTSSITGIFTLPSDDMLGRVWDMRLKPILDTDRAFQPPEDQHWVKRKGMVQLGHSMGLVTGCGEDDATSTPADFLFHDELDLSPPDMIALYQSRVQNSELKIRQLFSTPTHTDFGVDGLFKLSDQHFYMIKCPACNHYQLPEFNPTFVRTPNAKIHRDYLELSYPEIQLLNLTGAHVACEQCNRPLPLGDNSCREWVAKYPERTNIRGYDVTPFTNDRITVVDIFRQLAEYQRLDNRKGFENTVLGRAFTGENARLKQSQIEACIVNDPPEIPRDAKVYLGIDLGLTCHLVLGTPTKRGMLVFMFESLPVGMLLQRVLDLKEMYPRLTGAGDRVPYTPEMEAIRDATGHAVWPVQYTQPNSRRIVQVLDVAKECDHYQANRTMAIDAVATAVRRGELGFANLNHYRTVLVSHLQDMVRDEQPEKPAVWLKDTGNDHFFHALAFMMFATKIEESDEYFSKPIPQTLALVDTTTGWNPDSITNSVYNPFNRT